VIEEWKAAMESKGLKVNMEKTKLMVTGKELKRLDTEFNQEYGHVVVAVKELQ